MKLSKDTKEIVDIVNYLEVLKDKGDYTNNLFELLKDEYTRITDIHFSINSLRVEGEYTSTDVITTLKYVVNNPIQAIKYDITSFGTSPTVEDLIELKKEIEKDNKECLEVVNLLLPLLFPVEYNNAKCI